MSEPAALLYATGLLDGRNARMRNVGSREAACECSGSKVRKTIVGNGSLGEAADVLDNHPPGISPPPRH